MRNLKKVFSVLLVAAMVAGMCPVQSVMAQEVGQKKVEVTETPAEVENQTEETKEAGDPMPPTQETADPTEETRDPAEETQQPEVTEKDEPEQPAEDEQTVETEPEGAAAPEVTLAKEAAPAALNLNQEGKLDWVHLTATENTEETSKMVITRKADASILGIRKLDGTTGVLFQGDHATKYTWNSGASDGGDSYISMKDRPWGAVFGYQKGKFNGSVPTGTEVGYEITVPADAKGATDLAFVAGGYASKSQISVYANDESDTAAADVLDLSGAATNWYKLHFEAGTKVRVVVSLAEKKNINGNLFVGGITLSSADAPTPEDPDTKLEVTMEKASGSMNLSAEGKLDWMHFTGTTNKENTSTLVTTRKSADKKVIDFTLYDGVTGRLRQSDHAVAYSWIGGVSDGGDAYKDLANENLGVVLSYKQGSANGAVPEGTKVGYEFSIPAGTKATDLDFVAGGYASESVVNVYRADGSIAYTDTINPGTSAATNRYHIHVAEGSAFKVSVNMTKKNNVNGNLFIGGIALNSGETESGPAFYEPNTDCWLYFGWENDHPKSLSTMGGTLYAGEANGQWMKYKGIEPNPIRYTATINDTEYAPDETSPERTTNTKWYQADGYMNSPVSEWNAGDTGIAVKIHHVANRMLDDKATVVFTQVTLANQTKQAQTVTLNVSQPSSYEVPLNKLVPNEEGKNYCLYTREIPAGETAVLEFAAKAAGTATVAQIRDMDGFDKQYEAVKAYYDKLLEDMAVPVSLPDEEMTNSYKNSMLVMIESMVKNGTDYEIRGAAGTQNDLHNYDNTFPHDVPNMVEQFIQEGNLELAKRILGSKYYQNIIQDNGGNLDAIGKFILPYAKLWQVMDETERNAYFTDNIKNTIQTQAHQIPNYLNEDGIMQLSESFDNGGDYMSNLVVDNFASLHGLAAYQYLCDTWGWTDESSWADGQMKSLNTALNKALDDFMEREGKDWYMCDLTGHSMFWRNYKANRTIYDGNWLGTTFMMSTFPWDAKLRGYDLGGTWSDFLDKSIDNAMSLKAQRGDIPEGSWGAWWGNDYGAVYNVGMALPLLYSEKYRTTAVENYEWLLDNQCAPFQWGESFNKGQNEADWCASAFDYETWGLGFMRQGLLEATASVKTDGTLIVGRGIPNAWLESDTPIEWKNISVNDGRKLTDLQISKVGENKIQLSLAGDDAVNDIVFNLPIFKNNIASATAGSVNREEGTVTLSGNTKSVVVTLGEPVEKKLDSIELTKPEKTQYTVGEKFLAAGMKVTAHYSDGSNAEVTDYTVDGFDSSKTGVCKVTISYQEAGVAKIAVLEVTIKAKEEQTKPDAKPVVKAGWNRDAAGWKYADANKKILTSTWVKVKDKWYYMGADGYMKTGWQKIKNKWYYLSDSKNDGAMKIGWQKINNKWYYLSGSQSDGAMKIGWQKIGGQWYYLSGSQNDGAMKTGWQKVAGKWYYLYKNEKPSGHMAANTWIGKYYVNGSGAWTKTR